MMKQAANLKDVSPPLFLPGIKVGTSPTDYFTFQQLRLAKFDGQGVGVVRETYGQTRERDGAAGKLCALFHLSAD
jgi:hypothetical protein